MKNTNQPIQNLGKSKSKNKVTYPNNKSDDHGKTTDFPPCGFIMNSIILATNITDALGRAKALIDL